MITQKEKDLTIQLLTEKLERISGKKVVLKETNLLGDRGESITELLYINGKKVKQTPRNKDGRTKTHVHIPGGVTLDFKRNNIPGSQVSDLVEKVHQKFPSSNIGTLSHYKGGHGYVYDIQAWRGDIGKGTGCGMGENAKGNLFTPEELQEYL